MFDDFRSFIDELNNIGDIVKITGADWNLEIGALSELSALRRGPALLFDEVKGYPKGYRIASNVIMTPSRQKLAFGFPEGLSDLEIVRQWRGKFNQYKPVPPIEVKTGPIMENKSTGETIDILKFPAPKWHHRDGGRYIGTGVVNIVRDPDDGWVNCGTYRVMVHNEKTLAYYVSPGKHANIIRQKYWSKGESCPLVMCFGQDLILFAMSGMGLPWHMAEMEVVGYLKNKPLEVIKGEITGLPIPATAEIAVEGFAPPPSESCKPEGPFGEWTGYYASGAREEPIVDIKAVYYRDDPIMHGHPPVPPPANSWWPIPIQTASLLWNRLEIVGIPGIQGVYTHGPGTRIVSVISIKQMYLGHANQVGALAISLLSGGSCTGRYAIVVDEDIDASNWDEVMWAVTTRCDPENSIQIVRGFLSSPLDPMLSPDKREAGDFTTAKVIINACRPYHWIKSFPPVNKATDELKKKVLEKWPHIFK